MKDPIAYMLIGLGAGAFFALLATGIVVAFKGSGVINFAHGAMAMYVAFQFNAARTKGMVHLPWVDILPSKTLNLPVDIKVGHGHIAFIPAVILALATAVLLGALAHYLVFRPLRNAAPLGKIIGSLGVMLYLQGIALHNFGTENPQPETVFPKGIWHNFLGFGKPESKEAVYLAGAAVVFGAVLWFIYRYTRFGLATRAAASNEKGATLLGYSPESLARWNWILSAFLAGAAGIMVGSVTGALNPVKFTTLVVPALGAALIGSLSSVPWAVAGGLMLGMLEALSTTWLRSKSWFPDWLAGAAKDAVPLIVIVVVLFARGKSLPTRGSVEEKRLPLSPYPERVGWHVFIWGGAAVVAGFVLQGKWGFALTSSLIAAMLMLSFVVLTGYVGQISMAQMSIAGVAAFFMARLTANGAISPAQPFPVSGPNLPWPIASVMGIALAVVIGVLLGLPALRIRGVQLAVVTIAAAVSLQTLYFENVKLTDLRAGSNAALRPPTFFGVNIGAAGKNGLTDSTKFEVFCVIVLALLAVGVSNLRRSGTGRRFLAVRANERAAAAAGIRVQRNKLLAFAVASAVAGVAGVMTAFQQQQISSANWTFFLGLGFLAFAYLGGITSVNGALVGGLLAPSGLLTVFGNHHNPGLTNYTSIIGGVGMIVTAIQNPGGLALVLQPQLRYLGSWLKAARGPEWVRAIRRVLPGAIIGMIPVALLLIFKTRDFRNWYIPMTILLGLFLRAIGLQFYGGIQAKRAERRTVANLEAEAAAATSAASLAVADQGVGLPETVR